MNIYPENVKVVYCEFSEIQRHLEDLDKSNILEVVDGSAKCKFFAKNGKEQKPKWDDKSNKWFYTERGQENEH